MLGCCDSVEGVAGGASGASVFDGACLFSVNERGELWDTEDHFSSAVSVGLALIDSNEANVAPVFECCPDKRHLNAREDDCPFHGSVDVRGGSFDLNRIDFKPQCVCDRW